VWEAAGRRKRRKRWSLEGIASLLDRERERAAAASTTAVCAVLAKLASSCSSHGVAPCDGSGRREKKKKQQQLE
jgi:hypothetical protein